MIHAVHVSTQDLVAFQSDLRVLIYAFRRHLGHEVPVRSNRNAREDCSHNCSSATCCTDAHRDVDGESRSLKGEDTPVLEQDRKLGRGQSDMISNDAIEQVLLILAVLQHE